MWKYFLFDLDGTLTESGPGIKNGVRYALQSIGIVEEDEAVLETFIGPPLVESFAREYGKTSEEGFRLQDVFREYYKDQGVYENEPYPGVHSLLRNLREKGCVLVLASSKPLDMATKVLTHFDLQQYFDIVVCGEDQGLLFTKKGVIAEALRRCAMKEFHQGIDSVSASGRGSFDESHHNHVTEEELELIKKRAVMIGDRIYDMEGAGANGIPAVGAGWGYAPAGELEGSEAVRVCKDICELETYLREQING